MKKKGAALIGVGMVSSTYAQALHDLQESVSLTGVLGARSSSTKRFLAKHADRLTGDERAYTDVAENAGDEDVDFVLLATPPNARKEIVAALAHHGKHILMEKPVERTLAAAREICMLCEQQGVKLGIMLQHRARPSAKTLQELVTETDFGELLSVEINVPWWRPQAYYDEPGRGSYARDGGGVLISQAIHTLDLALQFSGPVADVTAMCATSGFHEMESEDFVSAGLRFARGAVGKLFASTASYPGYAESIGLHYRNASVRLESNLLRIEWQDGHSETIGESAATGAGADPMAFTSDWHRDVIEDFVQALDSGRDPLITGTSALAVHALIEAIEEAGRTGQRTAVSTDYRMEESS